MYHTLGRISRMLREIIHKDNRELIRMLFSSLRMCSAKELQQTHRYTITLQNRKTDVELYVLTNVWMKIRNRERMYITNINIATGELRQICYYDIYQGRFEYDIDPALPYTDYFSNYIELRVFEKAMIEALYDFVTEIYLSLKRKNNNHCAINLCVNYTQEDVQKVLGISYVANESDNTEISLLTPEQQSLFQKLGVDEHGKDNVPFIP